MTIAGQVRRLKQDFDEVLQAGLDDGWQEGFAEGCHEGYTDGFYAGRDQGFEEGYHDGLDYGEQVEYDRFWNAYQNNGKRRDYDNCFGGEGWTDETFKPKYDIVHTKGTAYMIFRKCGLVNLKETIEATGKSITLDSETLQYTFQYSPVLEVIDGITFTNPIKKLNGTFQFCPKLKKIQTLPISEWAVSPLEFIGIPALEEISFTGVIPVNISFVDSPNLTSDSVQSVIDHLKDLSEQTSQKVTFHSSVILRLTSEQADAITAKNWTF